MLSSKPKFSKFCQTLEVGVILVNFSAFGDSTLYYRLENFEVAACFGLEVVIFSNR